ncbi:colanic acid biosynthesis protein [Salmonella enterica subsp. enterica serovar Typhi]|nr:colanic acid biosynthesis protein [Salmonella enterica subsp. enterica serovar Typhi]CHQ00677.1 colanic acid biosynthesis protein [Salmonella enterica subsp. enterica serovar Typhi]
MTAAQIDTRKVEQGVDTAWLVERRHDEFVASYAVQHWLDVTARRKTVAITLRDLEPFDKRLGTTQQAYEQAFAQVVNRLIADGYYLSIPQNFKLNAIRLDNRQVAYKLRGIQISSGNAPSFVAITNVRMTRATLELHNQPQHLFLRNINVMQTSAIGPALKMHFDLRKDVRGQFMARQDTLLSLANVHAINENGQSSVDIDRINHQTVNVEAVNFSLPKRGG